MKRSRETGAGLSWRPCQTGGYAAHATRSSVPVISGCHRQNVSLHSSLSTWVLTWSNRWAPRFAQRICCFFTIRSAGQLGNGFCPRFKGIRPIVVMLHPKQLDMTQPLQGVEGRIWAYSSTRTENCSKDHAFVLKPLDSFILQRSPAASPRQSKRVPRTEAPCYQMFFSGDSGAYIRHCRTFSVSVTTNKITC